MSKKGAGLLMNGVAVMNLVSEYIKTYGLLMGERYCFADLSAELAMGAEFKVPTDELVNALRTEWKKRQDHSS